MSSFLYFIIITMPVAALVYLAYYSFKKRTEGKSSRRVLATNAAVFLAILVIASVLTLTVSANDGNTDANTNTAENAATEQTADNSKGLGLLAAGIVTGLAGIGGGIAVAAGAPAAIAATSEDPKVFGKALIFVALGETIALYGVVISILILNKV